MRSNMYPFYANGKAIFHFRLSCELVFLSLCRFINAQWDNLYGMFGNTHSHTHIVRRVHILLGSYGERREEKKARKVASAMVEERRV